MKRLSRIWRSMPLRLALLLVLLFAVVSLLSLAASYGMTKRAFEQAIREDLAQDIAGFRATPSARALSRLVEAESRETDPRRLVLSYVAPSGRIFGNGAIARDNEGYHIVSLREGNRRFHGEYLAYATMLHGGRLTIARSRADVERLGGVFLNILWVSLLPTVLIALSGGLVLARRSKRHVEVIRNTLDAVTTGDLAARVEVGKRWSDDLQQIGGSVNQMAAAQERSVAALKQVSLDIAHDLKTPVQRVSLQLDDLAGKLPEGEAAALVAAAQAEVEGISDVFDALLQLAHVEQDSLRSTFVQVDLGKMCETFEELFASDAHDRGQSLSVHTPDTPVFVQGERSLLGQMLANLVQNALRHAGSGAQIGIALAHTQAGAELTVTDNGPGIPPEERARVLERLYRLDRSRGTPGNGLGLSLVDGIVRLHGARLALEDAGPGLRARVTFPV